jgi:hypothetical protein
MTPSRAIIPACCAVLALFGATEAARAAPAAGESLAPVRPDICAPVTLQADLDRLSSRAIPVDVAFTQGKAVLGLG